MCACVCVCICVWCEYMHECMLTCRDRRLILGFFLNDWIRVLKLVWSLCSPSPQHPRTVDCKDHTLSNLEWLLQHLKKYCTHSIPVWDMVQLSVQVSLCFRGTPTNTMVSYSNSIVFAHSSRQASYVLHILSFACNLKCNTVVILCLLVNTDEKNVYMLSTVKLFSSQIFLTNSWPNPCVCFSE